MERYVKKRYKYLIAKDWPFVVVGCLVVKGKTVLLVKEARIEAGKWNQPAGWLEKYENPILGAKRETEEETGFKVKITKFKFLGVYSLDKRKIKGWHRTLLMDTHPIKLLFLAKIISKGKRVNPKKIKEIKWFGLAEVKNLYKRKLLRDPDIIQEVQDYLAGKEYDLGLVHHVKFFAGP
jgi:8-oxo-dGTP pyrophosphatase MutT (NUDIX family)